MFQYFKRFILASFLCLIALLSFAEAQDTTNSTYIRQASELFSEGENLLSQDDYTGALESYRNALRVLQDNNSNLELQVPILTRMGFTSTIMGNHHESISYYQKAIELNHVIGDPFVAANLHTFIGMSNIEILEIVKGIEHFLLAKELFEESGRTDRVAEMDARLERLNSNLQNILEEAEFTFSF